MKLYYKILLTLGSWLLALGFVKAQNLVYNGYFEIYTTCPNSTSLYPNNMQINYATGWGASALTPDYFNSCDGYGNEVDVPYNVDGYQQDCCGGGGYVGGYMLNTSTTNNDGREYIYTQLINTLKAGHKYLVSMYVNKADGWNYAVATIGMLFTDTVIILPWAQGFIHATPQVKHTTLIADTLNWTLIQDTIIAVGNEAYLTIGNFNTSATCDSVNIGGNGDFSTGAAYYYIDGVSVYDVATLGIEQYAGSKVQVALYPNPNNGSFSISYTGAGKQLSIEVDNLIGQQILNEQYIVVNATSIPVNGLNEGVYFVKVSVDNVLVKTTKVVVTK